MAECQIEGCTNDATRRLSVALLPECLRPASAAEPGEVELCWPHFRSFAPPPRPCEPQARRPRHQHGEPGGRWLGPAR